MRSSLKRPGLHPPPVGVSKVHQILKHAACSLLSPWAGQLNERQLWSLSAFPRNTGWPKLILRPLCSSHKQRSRLAGEIPPSRGK
ncbi:hypothetical protein GDO81_008243 [Engystomops pustulosus]|uniref:Uncharacterized protein n=1 Tax=Engystomops pustulosus TaxID=76066 RepID=A0AAV7CE54_ENGPU|nr:hypothetical protein GDO81_008243 [Engystomops pustulosus]